MTASGENETTITKERRDFRRRVLGNFVKYYSMLNDEEATEVEDIVNKAKNRFTHNDGE